MYQRFIALSQVGVLKEGVDVCDQNVVEVFNKALEKLKEKNNLFQVSSISMPNHLIAERLTGAFFYSGSYGTTVIGCGYGTGVTAQVKFSFLEKLIFNFSFDGRCLSKGLWWSSR